ncbi:Indoleamine 2,3-dioxygenase [Lasiosphaeria hispida]|uniref:Indoleamine 2,3-dioxygenase n=1 Tax=Lasiosphaeria hispida TaxID=260671 RepID=A0AAJ0H4Z6_9PEZI|nr:Indoleamine 2,3-dioxygenase [Lasiosphaeria hispida]
MSPFEAPPPARKPISVDNIQGLLEEFGISSNGFLPEHLPLDILPDPYYVPWEYLMQNLNNFLDAETFRQHADQLPILSLHRLVTYQEQQRAYVVLAFFAHAYIWGGDKASETLPPPISTPLLQISHHLNLPPVATYAALSLWNFRTTDPDDLTNLSAIHSLHTFTGTRDESWFYAVSIAIEARGARTIPLLLHALHSASVHDYPAVTTALHDLTQCITSLGDLLERMDEQCDPNVFYHRIRPFLAGSKNMAAAGLPCGVFYDRGGGEGEWRQLRGGSNGQSSLVQFFDGVLGVEHLHAACGRGNGKEMTFHEEVRGYMPDGHRRFLEYIAEVFPGGLRRALLEGGGHDGYDVRAVDGRLTCLGAYRAATDALAALRGKHLQMVTRYIIIPSRQPLYPGGAVNLATASSKVGKAVGDQGHEVKMGQSQLTGTGGTALLPFLKQSRDETSRAGLI